jgi:serine protease AprX
MAMGGAFCAAWSVAAARRLAAVAAAAFACATVANAADGAVAVAGAEARSCASAQATLVGVVVSERSSGSPRAERLVRRLGGRMTRKLPIIRGFAADVPAAALPRLERSRSVAAVWRDGVVSMSATGVEPDDDLDDVDDDDFDDHDLDDASHYDSLPPNQAWRDAVGLHAVGRFYDGEDVAVAVLDTGVSRVAALSEAVEARVDFTPAHDGVDRFGHGTHMAGIIAGDGGAWRAVAPAAELISIKVAGPDGATDVSVVLAALQWIVTNKERFGIRVLNLSFGTDSARSYVTDPLNAAVERVWQAGILVVAAAGNRGPDAGSVTKPGDDPFVLTVGAADLRGTVNRRDDVVAPFSSRGPTIDGVAKPDVVAPGMSIVSTRAPRSLADLDRPEARVGAAHFKGTGTSQAAAIVSGIAALMFEANPALTPGEAKAAIVGSSSGLQGQDGAGSGLVDAAAAVAAVRAGTYRNAAVTIPYATGEGPIEPSRGSYHVYSDPDRDGVPQEISGEVDALGNAWDATAWSATPWSTEAWRASPWRPLVTAFEEWAMSPWTGPTWSGTVVDATAWSARHWSQSEWVARHWSARHWSGSAWN